jgi:hypothetical protein
MPDSSIVQRLADDKTPESPTESAQDFQEERQIRGVRVMSLDILSLNEKLLISPVVSFFIEHTDGQFYLCSG